MATAFLDAKSYETMLVEVLGYFCPIIICFKDYLETGSIWRDDTELYGPMNNKKPSWMVGLRGSWLVGHVLPGGG